MSSKKDSRAIRPNRNNDFHYLSSDGSDGEAPKGPLRFTPVSRRRRHADVVTPQKSAGVDTTKVVHESSTNSKPVPTRNTAPITPNPSQSISTYQNSARHGGTPAGRKGGVLKAFSSLSMNEGTSISAKSSNKEAIVLSDTDTESADSDGGYFNPAVQVKPLKPPNFQLPTPPSSQNNVIPNSTVIRFAERPMDSELESFTIAHCPETQALFDAKQIAWGTQYELARGVNGGAWTWEDVRSRLDRLRGNNSASAWKVAHVMKDQDVNNPALISPLWRQLDLEQDAILENKARGLGLMDEEWQGEKNWYGGQIQQIARVVKKNGLLGLGMEPMENRRSHRFARFYGSRRIFQVKIPDDYLKDGYDQPYGSACESMKKFLSKKFILCGRCFVPFHAKEGSVYLMETDSNYERTTQTWCGDQYRMSLNEFLRWHNPLEETANYEQYISKWVTRFALGLSTSIPVLQFKEQNIFFIEDIVADDWPPNKKAPAEKLMTDGCGFMNNAALTAISKYLDRDNIMPVGVQGRIAGGKGFWILKPDDHSEEPKIWIRDSQKKIHYPSFDRAHLIFDLLGTTGPSGEMNLSKQSIQNLFANGIAQETLVTMMEESLSEVIMPLLDWKDVVVLYNAIGRAGNVGGTRAQRAAAGRSRALGLSGREWGETHEESTGEYIDVSATTYTGRNAYSQAPVSLYESALELVQAGFTPSTNQLLYDKMKYIMQNVVDAAVKECRIPLKHSFGAYVVPDPFDILNENEIYYQFSYPRKHAVTGLPFSVLEGDVVVGRYPIRLPSDMRKVKAVNKPSLCNYMDVIVISTKGSRSLASLLAGGDMDGDEWVVFYDPSIVQPFETKPFTEEPSDLMRNFHAQDVEKIPEFCRRLPKQQEFIEKLLSNIEKPQVGIYSTFHEAAIIKHGYDHSETIRLAYIFAVLLDSSKNGKRINGQVFQADRKTYQRKKSVPDATSTPDILEILAQAARRKGDELMLLHATADQSLLSKPDPVLRMQYDSACEHYQIPDPMPYSTFFFQETALIRRHVDAAFDLYRIGTSQKQQKRSLQQNNKKSSRDRKSDQKDPVLEAARLFAEPIPGIVLIRDVDEVKAGFAYSLSPNFAFSVAFGILCLIKAKSSPGGVVPSIRLIDEARVVAPSYLRALSK